MASASQILSGINAGEPKALSRALTLVENELDCWQDILQGLKDNGKARVVGITGPPGAGKSTLVNSLISHLSVEEKRIAVLAIDPTSPFNFGSLLGDRVRMNRHFTNKNVFIRSLATRGSLGGLSVKAIEMTDVLKAASFDYIFVETVGVGQSEVEVAGLADVTVVVLVPESGDEVQLMKSGLMEIADIFVVNKSDRQGADIFANNLLKMLHQKDAEIPVINTSAENSEGVAILAEQLGAVKISSKYKVELQAEKAYQLIAQQHMRGVNKERLAKEIALLSGQNDFNLYRFVDGKIKNS